MAVTFPLASPRQWGVGSVSWSARDNIARARNPFTLTLLTQVFDGKMWQGQISLVAQTEAEGRRLSAWLAALRRSGTDTGTFLWEGPARPVPLGSAASTPGTPVINGADQTGESLNVSGLPVSTNGYLLAGDFIQVGSGATSRLNMVLEDVDSDSGGLATLTLWPGIRTAPGNGSSVVVSGAQGVFVTLGNTSDWTAAPAVYPGVTLNVAEVVP